MNLGPSETDSHPSKIGLVCAHCCNKIQGSIFYDDDDSEMLSPFCCRGCQSVSSIIKKSHLEYFYEIQDKSHRSSTNRPLNEVLPDYTYFDSPHFYKDFVEEYPEKKKIKLFVQNVHCLACLWILEKLPEINEDCFFAKLDVGRSLLYLELKKEAKLGQIASQIHMLGYPVGPIQDIKETDDYQKKEWRKDFLRIGIAGAGMGNIMLSSLSLYSGAQGQWANYFHTFGLIFLFPVVFYSALPFYRNAILGLKQKKLNLDFPISFAIIVIFSHGVIQHFRGSYSSYLDTLATLVFLLLLARSFVKKLTQNLYQAKDFSKFYQNSMAIRVKDDGLEEEVYAETITPGDKIKVLPGKIFPCDGSVYSGESLVNNSLLTGESDYVPVKNGHQVFSGTQNIEAPLFVKVEKVSHQTRLGKILDSIQKQQIDGKLSFSTSIDQLSEYFVKIVFLLALLALLYFGLLNGQWEIGMERAFVLIIITCPCALALATPLALTNSLLMASKKGIFIKNEWALEKISKIKSIIADKTGTLTYGQLKMIHFSIHDDSYTKKKILSLVLTLEDRSQHPMALSLKNYIREQNSFYCQILTLKNFKEEIGVGVSGTIENHFYQIKAMPVNKGSFHGLITILGLYCDETLVASFHLQDQIREEAKDIVRFAKKSISKFFILSGDREESVKNCAEQIGVSVNDAFFNQSPEDKLDFIKDHPYSLMMGDGANDSMALSKSFVGMAVSGSVEIGLHVSDIYTSRPGLKSLPFIIDLSNETVSLIRRNLVISFFYNLIGIFLAFTGFINPLMAAILMPLSSLSVILSTILGTKKLRNLKKIEI